VHWALAVVSVTLLAFVRALRGELSVPLRPDLRGRG
jgi:hypothetical protein